MRSCPDTDIDPQSLTLIFKSRFGLNFGSALLTITDIHVVSWRHNYDDYWKLRSAHVCLKSWVFY